MLGAANAEPPGHAVESPLEGRVAERLDPSAVVAHEVVMVIAVGRGPLETRDAVSDLHTLHDPERRERLDDPVNARDPDSSPVLSDAVVDLLRGPAALLDVEVLNDRTPRPAGPQAGGTECCEGVSPPVAVLVHLAK